MDFNDFFELYPLGKELGSVISDLVDWLTVTAEPIFTLIKWPIEGVLDSSEALLLAIPWPIIVLIFAAIGWYKGRAPMAALAAVGFIIVGFLGYWDLTMTTLSMILTALVFCVVVGTPLGILAARSDKIESVVRPVLDAMQTIHPFVYLIPVVMFFGIGKVPGTIATVFFALPPMVRLTNLGIRQVPHDVVEAGRAFGSNDMQLLFDVQLPLALPTIMAGLNQTLMLALSMVVIVALIAGGGLGQEIYGAVSSMNIGRAVTSGLAVLVLAIMLDRLSQVKGKGTHAT
jgi:glycine betaine/proline transport system permease protein